MKSNFVTCVSKSSNEALLRTGTRPEFLRAQASVPVVLVFSTQANRRGWSLSVVRGQ